MKNISLWIRGELGNLHPDTLDAIKGLLMLAFIIVFIVGCTILMTLDLNEKARAKAICKEHGYLDVEKKFGEWACGSLEDGRVVLVLLSEVVDGNKVP